MSDSINSDSALGRMELYPSVILASVAPTFWLLSKLQFMTLGSKGLVNMVDAHLPGGTIGLVVLSVATLFSFVVILCGAFSAIRGRRSGGDTSSTFSRQSLALVAFWAIVSALPATPI
jgi:hypothetical protein